MSIGIHVYINEAQEVIFFMMYYDYRGNDDLPCMGILCIKSIDRLCCILLYKK